MENKAKRLQRASLTPSVVGLRGFTLIELLVVMTIIATLLTIAVPGFFHSVEKSKEVVLRQDFSLMREAIDKYFGGKGKCPDNLEDQTTQKYLHSIPSDSITKTTSTWPCATLR